MNKCDGHPADCRRRGADTGQFLCGTAAGGKPDFNIDMWEQEEFAKHWRNEFPDGKVPHMDLNSVDDIESELETSKTNLKRLQKALAEEKFKVIYLQTTMALQDQ